MAISVALGTPLADELSKVVQPKLTEVGWSTGSSDDSALAEYIILMLVNGKTQDQIATDLSNDLLNLGPNDSGATDFARWLFEQVDVLSGQMNGDSTSQAEPVSHQSAGQPIPSLGNEGTPRGTRGESGVVDADMGDAMDLTNDGSIPTGPKSMRNGSRPGNRKLMGQLSKAMDRSTDASLHRSRPHQGAGRGDLHNRMPPRGPRADLRSGGIRKPEVNNLQRPGPPRGPGGVIPQMTAQQQMQLLQFYEQQSKIMSQILTPSQQMALMPQASGVAINPAFRNGMGGPHPPGRSLFDRVERKAQRPNGNFNHRVQHHQIPASLGHEVEMGGNDISSSMEVESSQPGSNEIPPEAICKYNLKCAKPECSFAHQSSAAPPGTTVDPTDTCSFGVACQNRKCTGRHPSPAQKKNHQSEQECKFFPHCTNPQCPFKHPSMPVCRNGADCTTDGCKFTHVKTPCRFNPCLNHSCPYKHEEGQKRGSFGDKVWTADQEKEHVSERRFVTNENEIEEELVVPVNVSINGTSESMGTELVT